MQKEPEQTDQRQLEMPVAVGTTRLRGEQYTTKNSSSDRVVIAGTLVDLKNARLQQGKLAS